MKRLALLALSAALAAAPLAAEPAAPKDDYDVVLVKQNDPAMTSAIAEAKRALPEFLGVLAKPAGATGFTFKYPLGGWEHIWVEQVARQGRTLTGVLANHPEQPGHAIGDRVTVPLAQVSDWGYRDADGVMHGQRTTRVLLPRLDPADAAEIRRSFGWED